MSNSLFNPANRYFKGSNNEKKSIKYAYEILVFLQEQMEEKKKIQSLYVPPINSFLKTSQTDFEKAISKRHNREKTRYTHELGILLNYGLIKKYYDYQSSGTAHGKDSYIITEKGLKALDEWNKTQATTKTDAKPINRMAAHHN